MITINADVELGKTFIEVYPSALGVAKSLGVNVKFRFNDLECIATPKGDEVTAQNLYFEATKNKDSIHYKLKHIYC